MNEDIRIANRCMIMRWVSTASARMMRVNAYAAQ